MESLKLYNSLSGKKEIFEPIDKNEVKIYACGPTVYNDMHLGNVRPQINFDTLRRYLIYKGYNVKYVSNFTDVDDKIIKKANEENTDITEITTRYIKSVKEDLENLGVYDNPIIHPTCTCHMHDIIEFIEELIKVGAAYQVGGNVYFNIETKKDYGKLSKKQLDELISGSRVEVNDEKKNPLDFVLWKEKKEGEVFWESPWGEGRPGWHIECSAMARKLLGDQIDIHAGGEDLKFPHHENEIAQTESLTHKKFANFWIHNGMINIENKKMSKSLGNFFYAKDFMKENTPEVLRFFILLTHYRKPINFTDESVESAKKGLKKLKNSRKRLEELLENAKEGPADEMIVKSVQEIRNDFIKHMDDDLNTPDAITDFFNLSKLINTKIDDNTTKDTLEKIYDLFEEMVEVLGVCKKEVAESIDQKIEELIQRREEMRKNKNFAEADKIRDELLSMGITLTDTKDGVKWTKK